MPRSRSALPGRDRPPARRRRPRAAGALVPARAPPASAADGPHDDRPGRSSRATSGPGSWFAVAVDSRTPAPRSPASSGSPAASTRGPASGPRSSWPPARARSTCCMRCRRRFGGQHEGPARERRQGGRRGARSPSRSTTRPSSSSGVVAENPAKLVGQLDLLPNQNGAAPVDRRRSPRPTCPSASRPGRRSTASCGRTSTRRPSRRPARRAADVDRRRRTPRHRRRHRRRGRPRPASRTTCCPTGPTAILDIDPAVLRPILGGVAGRRRDAHGLRGRPGRRARARDRPATA